MKMTRHKPNLGDLIAALYQEIARITSNKKLQTKLVYLALIDMRVTRKV